MGKEEKKIGPDVGDASLLDASADTGLLIHVDEFYAAHPIQGADVSCGENVFESPRVQVSVVTNQGPLIGLHYHATSDEIVYVHKGEGEMYVGGKWVPVKAGDIHVNPRGVVHATRITGSKPMEVIGFFSAAPENGNDKVFLPEFDGKVVGAKTLLDANVQEGLLIHLPEFYASHPRPVDAGARSDSVYKSPRAELFIGENHGPLLNRHYHAACEEIVFVYGGSGEMYIGGEWVPVKAGDLHINPRGVYHTARCVGKDMQVVCLFTPPQANGDDKVFINE